MEITLPHKFSPRHYQLPKFQAFDSGIKRGVSVWHRRSGKDTSDLNLCIKKMPERVGAYFHLFPTAKQGRKVMWDGVNRDGFKFMDHFPKELITKKSESEMKVELFNGSYYQVIGVDRSLDWLRGTNPIFVIFSEYSIMNPKAWDVIRPILKENGGIAIFNYTPQGENHGYDLYQMARDNPNWYCDLLTVDDTKRGDGSPIVTPEDIDEERAEGMSEEMIQQEYYCSFQAAVPGSYFGKEIMKAEKDGRITAVPYDPKLLVETWWDLGYADVTSIWFTQRVGGEIRCIDYYESSGEGLPYYARVLKEQKPYLYEAHHFPHDMEVHEIGSGETRLKIAKSLGLTPAKVGKRVMKKEDAIEAGRVIIPRCYFDKEKCKDGLAALRNYHKEFDDKLRTFKMVPVHDWASHGADSFMELAMEWERSTPKKSQSLEDKYKQLDKAMA